jgi:hypothetical protein
LNTRHGYCEEYRLRNFFWTSLVLFRIPVGLCVSVSLRSVVAGLKFVS